MTREELWLAAIAGLDGINPPDYPVWHYEQMLAAIYDAVVGAADPRPFPERSWHLDEFLWAVYCAVAGLADPGIPAPTCRIEEFWRGIYLKAMNDEDAAIPTPVWRIEEFLAEVFNNLTTAELKTVTGTMIHVLDALAKPAEELLVDLSPIQDLHGYANPWPAGGGVNKYDKSADYYGQGKFWNSSTGALKSSDDYYGSPKIPVLPNTQYVRTNTGTSANIYYDADGNFLSSAGTGTSVSTPANAYYVAFNVPNATDHATLQLELGSSLSAYSPYSNICPISGLAGLSVYRTGKNLIDPSKKAIAPGSTTTARWYNDGTGFLLHSGKEYALSGNVSTDATYFVYIYSIGGTQLSYGKWTATYTPSADVYVYFQFYESGGAHLADAELQLELGSTATTYEPYNGNTYAVDWTTPAGTVYSGTVDVVSGELTVDMVNIPSYNGETINEPWLSSMDAYAAGTTPTIGAQVVYTLATPLTYQLTAQEVQMLLGENYVWSSSGDTVSVTYYAEGNANPLQSLNILLGGRYSNPKTADDVSDKEALEIILGGNK